MADIFGYSDNVGSAADVASADFASIQIGSGKDALVQNCQVTYGQTIEEVTQVGSTSIFWMPGRAKGSISVASLVGSGGFFEGFRDRECGRIDSGEVTVDGGKCGFTGSGSLVFEGGIVESLSATLTSQTQTIAQNVTMRIAELKAS